MSRGFWILLFITVFAVTASVFDFKWEEHKEEKKKLTTKIFPVELDAIEKVEIENFNAKENKRQLITIEKVNNTWKLTSPIQDEVEYSQVTDLVGSLSSEVYEKVIAKGTSVDLSIYGLQDQANLDRIRVKGATLPNEGYSVVRGKQKNFEGKVYLKPEFGETQVYLASSKWDSLFDRDAFSLRDKRMLKSVEGLKEIKIKLSSSEILMKLEDGKWVAPKFPQFKLDQNKVRESLYIFTSQAILAFVRETNPSKDDIMLFGLKSPVAEVSLRFEGDKVWNASLGQDKDGQYFVWLKEAKKVVRIAQVDFNKVTKLSWKQLRDRRDAFDFKTENVKKVRVSKLENYVELEKKDSKWVKLASANPDLNVSSDTIQELLDKMSILNVEEFSEDVNLSPEKLKNLERDLPFKIDLTDDVGSSILMVTFGPAKSYQIDKSKKNLVAVKSSRSQDLVFLAEADFNKLDLDQLLSTQPQTQKKESQK